MVAALVSFLPAVLFLAGLYLLDSFKLVARKWLIYSFAWGIVGAQVAWIVNTTVNQATAFDYQQFIRYVSPVTEELIKALFIIFLIRKRHIGFTIDAAIYGFAVGAGFALAENLHLIFGAGTDQGLMVWVLRGFGTSMMHGGGCALFAIVMIAGIQRDIHPAVAVIPGLVIAIMLHSAFNHFLLDLYLQTMLIFILFPLIFGITFYRAGQLLRAWMEIELATEVRLLGMIKRGELADDKAGKYLLSLKHQCSPEMILDIYCYLTLHLELSLLVKRNILLKEAGIQWMETQDVSDKLKEFSALRRRIGVTGMLALQPLLKMKYRELWKITQLES
ncbi:MAG: PrsW family glutamic-type intramembrane protease [Bacteroidales bacterium]